MKQWQEKSNQYIEEKNKWYFNLLLPLYGAATIGYFIFRFEISLLAVFWYTIPLLIVELYNSITTVVHLILTQKISHPVWKKPLENRTIDAFIPTYNEPTEIVEMTAVAAKNIRGIRNVYILDDGNRDGIRKLAGEIGVRYLARGENSFAKAGNMNFGLKQSDAEFVIFFDCDHVPQSNFIERTLGYFEDEKLAFVQTPQVFYNADTLEFRKLSFRKLWNEQTMFYESIQPAKNRFNAGFFCGTGAILRRSALDSVGGFATGTATEDIHTSLRLHAKGWRSIFLSEKLSAGLAPEDLKEYHQQRVRWGAGSLGLLFRTSDSPLIKRGLTIMQRLCYLNSTNAYFYGGLIKLFYMILPVIIIFSLPFVHKLGQAFLIQYFLVAVPFFILSNVITYLYSRKTFHFLFTEQYNIANIFSCIEAMKGILKVQKKFRVSIKAKKFTETHISYYYTIGLFIILLAADIFGITFSLVGIQTSPSIILNSFVAISVAWNTYNLIIVGSFIEFLQGYNKRRRNKHQFIADNLVSVGTITGKLSRISLTGAEIEVSSLPSGKSFSVVIHTLHPIALKAKLLHHKILKTRTILLDIEFLNLDRHLRDRLIEFFFDDLVPDLFANDFVKKREKTSPVIEGLPPLASFKNYRVTEVYDSSHIEESLNTPS